MVWGKGDYSRAPQLRDALTRGFLIREEIAHAKVGNPTTLLTRFAEELRRAPGAGGELGVKVPRLRDPACAGDLQFRIGEGIAHAKDGMEEQDGEGSYGLVVVSLRRMLRARCSLISLCRGTG